MNEYFFIHSYIFLLYSHLQQMSTKLYYYIKKMDTLEYIHSFLLDKYNKKFYELILLNFSANPKRYKNA